MALRRRLGFIFQAHNLHESLTAAQNVDDGRAGAWWRARPDGGTGSTSCAWSCRPCGPHELFTGQPVWRTEAARGGGPRTGVQPALVLADEPTAALDKDSAAEVVDLLKRMGQSRGTTTLLVTHDNRILDRADLILTLEDGRIIRVEERN